jgi:lathosterol oxidase
MFWTLASGVTVWTAYETFFLWGYASGQLEIMDWRSNPVWFALLFLLIPIWSSLHFYFVHRSLNWRPLYRMAHALHHRNVNVGPWSGLSMHPIEHVIYISSVMIHWPIESHPVHVLFHLLYLTLGAATSHAGYESLLMSQRHRMKLGSFYHQLHHRYVEYNYGNMEMPWDRWFGSYHDGTPEATRRMRDKRRSAI